MFQRIATLLLSALLLSTFSLSPGVAEEDPFPGVALGSEIPGTRVTSDPGMTQAQWEATSTYLLFSCPTGSGRGMGVDLNFTTDRSDDRWYAYCVKQWQSQTSIDAWSNYRTRLQEAQAAAERESRAWNAANPGKQKCVQWGPIVDPNGGESSGGVCANPVEPGAGTTVPTEEAPAVTVEETTTTTTTTPTTPAATPEPVSNSSQFIEDTSYQGSGYPYTKIYRGQLSTTDCPIGYQGANGLIVAIGIGTFTECWPANAWAAYRLGGSIWESFKSSGGTYDALAEVKRRENIETLKREAKRVAQLAADQTPGVQRCSRWTGYGESGTECAYAFVAPSETDIAVSESSTATSDSSVVVSDSSSSLANESESTTSSSSLEDSESVTVTIVPLEEETSSVVTSVAFDSSTTTSPGSSNDSSTETSATYTNLFVSRSTLARYQL